MLIRVRYGDDATLLCNANCAVVNLLSSIRTRAALPHAFDLADQSGTCRHAVRRSSATTYTA